MDGKMENNLKPTDDIFPDCWKDDVRMNSLFAPFRKRSANPLDWDSKLKFWKSLIEKWCAQANRPVFTVAEVITAFERKGRRALCLPMVVSEILRSGEGCKLSDFERGAVSGAVLAGKDGAPGTFGSWTGWAVGVMVKRPLSWAVGRLWSGAEGSNPPEVDTDEPILLMSVLKNISYKIRESGTAELVDVNELQKSAASKENFRLALLLLQRRGLATTATCGQRTLVKLASEGDKMATPAASDLAISEVERSAYVLQKDEAFLQQNIEQLEEEKARLTEEARGYVRKGMRQLAKSSLRKRHAMEQCIEKRVQALENLQSLLHRVKEAETDGQVLESYKIGVAALKKTLSEAGLTEDNVENTRAELEDVLELHGDVAGAMADVGKLGVVNGEEEELEDELAELLSQQHVTAEEKPSAETPKNKKAGIDEWAENIEKRLKTLTVDDLPSPPSDPLNIMPSVKVGSRILSPESQ